MKTTKEMHEKYYKKLSEWTNLTPDFLYTFNYERWFFFTEIIDLHATLNTEFINYVLDGSKLVQFVKMEEKRVNKKWKKSKII